MISLQAEVNSALCKEDIENLLKIGAPDDEYLPEAKAIVAALMRLPDDKVDENSIAAVVALVWQKYFKLSSQDIDARMPAFRRVARCLNGR